MTTDDSLHKTQQILVISCSYLPDIGGLETHLHDLLGVINRKGMKTILITFKPYQLNRLNVRLLSHLGNHVTIIRLPRFFHRFFFRGGRWNPIGDLLSQPLMLLTVFACCLKVRSSLKAIHINGISSSPFVARIGRLFGVKVILSIHYQFEPNPNMAEIFRRIVFRGIHSILVLSNKELQKVRDIGVGEKATLFRYWVDLELFKPLSRSKDIKKFNSTRKLTVLFVARLVEEKGVHIVLELARLYQNYKPVDFVVVGTGILENIVKEESLRLSNLRYLGPLETEDLPSVYNSSDILIVPSIHEEGLGRVIIEALACGVPVIGSALGGIPEIVVPEVGFLVDPTVDGFRQCIDSILLKPTSLQVFHENCRSYAERYFGERNAETIISLYEDDIDKHTSPSA